MIVCICHRVSDRDIHRAVHNGCRSFDELQDELLVATACGACTGCAKQLLQTQVAACLSACPTGSLEPCAAPLKSIKPLVQEVA